MHILISTDHRSTAYIAFRQDAFYENYFESQRDHIFRSVELLIYVFDIESREIDVRRASLRFNTVNHHAFCVSTERYGAFRRVPGSD